jgi:large subunit ribosomal protein L3
MSVKALITRKIGMTSVINENGEAIAVTLLSASPNVVMQVKDGERDGYNALQLGFEDGKNVAKPQQGHFKQAKIMPKIIREFRISEQDEALGVGEKLSADIFSVGDSVDVTGVSKGKGFAGTIKRHNFKRGRKTHGGRSYRRPGSIGSMYPQHIFKGKKMAGQMGNVKRTARRLEVALIDMDLNVIGVKGSVPGPRKGVVLLKETK